MKTLLKLYKMFYRLLRLKHWQRRCTANFCAIRTILEMNVTDCIKRFFNGNVWPVYMEREHLKN